VYTLFVGAYPVNWSPPGLYGPVEPGYGGPGIVETPPLPFYGGTYGPWGLGAPPVPF